MACDPEILKSVPLFSLLDDEERAVLASTVAVRQFEANQKVYKAGAGAAKGYVVVKGRVRVTLIDDDQQETTVDEPGGGAFFGFASLLDGTPHQTSATAMEESTCLEIGREDLSRLIQQRPEAGMDMLTVVGRHFHATQKLVQMRSLRNANEMIEEQETFGDRISDEVARFGGSWRFIILFGIILVSYTTWNVVLGPKAWDPYPFILLNLFLSMIAAIQAPVIMMSQNRQDMKDRMRSELDYEVNRRAEMEIRALSQKLNQMSDRLDSFEDFWRERRG